MGDPIMLNPKFGVTEDGEIIEGEDLERRRMEAMLPQAYEAKDMKARGERILAILLGTNDKPGPLREWAIEHPLDELRDGESGTRLERSEASTPASLDAMSLAEQHPDVLIKLAQLGLLKLDMTAWKAHAKNFIEAETAKRFIMPGGTVLKLEVKKDANRNR